MIRDIIYNIQDYINEILVNKLHKPYMCKDLHIFKINRIVTQLQDVTVDDSIDKMNITQRTYVTDIITNKDYVIPSAVLSEEEAEKVNVQYRVYTMSIPL